MHGAALRSGSATQRQSVSQACRANESYFPSLGWGAICFWIMVLKNFQVRYWKMKVKPQRHVTAKFWWYSHIARDRGRYRERDGEQCWHDRKQWVLVHVPVSDQYEYFYKDCTCWRWVGNENRMKLAWKNKNTSRQRLDVLLVSLYFSSQIHSGSVSCSLSTSTVKL